MREAHREVVETTDLVVYDMQHFGAYLDYDLTEIVACAKDLDKAWMPTPGVRKIHADYIMAWNKLCIEMLTHDPRAVAHLTGAKAMPKGTPTLEVSANPYRNKTTGEVRLWAEPQFLSVGHVGQRNLDENKPPIDILTGEVMKDWWVEWHAYGRFHSHNTMGCSPSPTDDASELTQPGFCCIFGQYKKNDTWPGGYEFKCGASVVTPNPAKPTHNMRRWLVAYQKDGSEDMLTRALSPNDMFDWNPESTATFHENVWTNIMYEEPPEWADLVSQGLGKVIYVSDYRKDDDWEARWGKRSYTGYGSSYRQYDEDLDLAFEGTAFAPAVKSDIRWRMRSILNMLREIEENCEEELCDARAVISAALWNVHNIDAAWIDDDRHEDEEVDNPEQAERDAIRDFALEYEID